MSESPAAVQPISHSGKLAAARSHGFAALQSPDVLLCLALLPVLVLTNVLLPGTAPPLRIADGLVTGLITPGFLLTCALFPAKSDLGTAGRWALTLVLSPVIAIVLILLLSLATLRVDVGSATLALAATCLALGVAALARRSSVPVTERARAHLPRDRAVWGSIMGAAVLLAVIWTTAGTAFISHSPEFFVSTADGRLLDSPHVLAADMPEWVWLSATNPGNTAHRYTLTVQGYSPPFHVERPVRVAPHTTWRERIPLWTSSPPGLRSVAFVLSEHGQPVRHLRYSFRVTP